MQLLTAHRPLLAGSNLYLDCPSESSRGNNENNTDRHSHRIEAWSAFLLAAIETKADISLVELAETLAAEHGVRFAPSTIWRCLDRHDMTVRLCCKNSLFLDSRNESMVVADYDEQAAIPDLPHDELVFV